MVTRIRLAAASVTLAALLAAGAACGDPSPAPAPVTKADDYAAPAAAATLPPPAPRTATPTKADAYAAPAAAAAVPTPAPTVPAPRANDYATTDSFRSALDAYQAQDQDAFRGDCNVVMWWLIRSIEESSDALYPRGERAEWEPGEQVEWVNNRLLVHLSAIADSGWKGAGVEYLEAFQAVCDDHLPGSIPLGPGLAG